MAAWQFVIDLIPNSWVAEDGDFHSLLEDDGIDTRLAWSKVAINLGDITSAISFLEQTTSWDSNLKLWGDIEKTDIQIWTENKIVESMQIRLDLREDVSEVSEEIFTMSNKLGCSLLDREKLTLISDKNELIAAINASRAAQFVQSPARSLS